MTKYPSRNGSPHKCEKHLKFKFFQEKMTVFVLTLEWLRIPYPNIQI